MCPPKMSCLPYVGGMSPGDSPTTTIVTGWHWTFVEHFDRWSLLLANTNLRLIGSRYGHDFLQLIYNSLVAGLRCCISHAFGMNNLLRFDAGQCLQEVVVKLLQLFASRELESNLRQAGVGTDEFED